jgi:hypothetical protein
LAGFGAALAGAFVDVFTGSFLTGGGLAGVGFLGVDLAGWAILGAGLKSSSSSSESTSTTFRFEGVSFFTGVSFFAAGLVGVPFLAPLDLGCCEDSISCIISSSKSKSSSSTIKSSSSALAGLAAFLGVGFLGGRAVRFILLVVSK